MLLSMNESAWLKTVAMAAPALPMSNPITSSRSRKIFVTAAMLILLLFRYRWLKSWMTVLIVNLVCQSALSLMLMNKINFNPNLIGVQFLAMIGVLIVQIPLFWLTMNENGSEASVRYAFWSNLATAALNHIFLLNCPL